MKRRFSLSPIAIVGGRGRRLAMGGGRLAYRPHFHYFRVLSLQVGTAILWAALVINRGLAIGSPTHWQTGADFHAALRSSIDLTWENRPLREGLTALGTAQGVAIFLDRRADPNARTNYACQGLPLRSAVQQIAAQHQLALGYVGPVIYVGPPLTCARIATLAEWQNEQVRSLPPAVQRRLLQRQPLVWPDLAEPRLIATQVAARAGLALPNLPAIPHDLWRAAELPPLTTPECLTLLLAGYDLTIRLSPTAAEASVVRFPRAVALERQYPVRNVEAAVRRLKAEFPQAFVRAADQEGLVTVKSTLEDHWKIAEQLRPPASGPASDASEKRYTLTIRNQPAERVLSVLAQQMGLELVIHASVPSDKKKSLINLQVTEASSDELWQAVSDSTGLNVIPSAGQLTVAPR